MSAKKCETVRTAPDRTGTECGRCEMPIGIALRTIQRRGECAKEIDATSERLSKANPDMQANGARCGAPSCASSGAIRG